MTTLTEHTPKARLTTARLLLAQFDSQLAEWKHMAPARRKRTVRGRDLASRLDGLKDGRVKWAARVAELEAIVAKGKGAGCCGEGEACSAPDCTGTPRPGREDDPGAESG